jgi:hypothetical protein
MPFPSPDSSPRPIIPPRELVQQWYDEARGAGAKDIWQFIATRAAQWGADQELDACCKWLQCNAGEFIPGDLRGARRPKAPSLKEQALEDLEQIDGYAVDQLSSYQIYDELKRRVSNIRRALEQLPE